MNRGAYRRSTLATSAIAAVFSLMAFGAQGADTIYQFDIPAEPLAQALTDFSESSGHQIVFSEDDLRGLNSAGLHGRYTISEGLSSLFGGTNLRAETTANGVLVVRPKNVQAASSIEAAAPGDAIETVMVTAEKRAEDVRNVPISMSVLSGKALDASTYQGVSDALNSVPGVSALTAFQGGSTLINVRGVGASNTFFTGPSAIAYYVDGVPYGLVDSAVVPDTNVYDLDRVEVLRGPQGTLYGASALNGVVRILTQDADLSDYDFKARAGVSDTQGGGLNFGGDVAANVPIIDGKLAVRGVAGYEGLSGWINSPIKNDINNARLQNYRFKVNADPNDRLSIGLSAWLSRQHYGALPEANDQGRVPNGISTPIDTDFSAFGLKVDYEFPGVSVLSQTSYLNYKSKDTFDFFQALGLGFDGPLNEKFGANVFSEELNLNSSSTGPWHWTAGAFYRDASNSTDQTVPSIATLDWTEASRSYAAFGEISRSFFNDTLQLTFGERYFHDDVTTRENHETAPINGSSYYKEGVPFSATTPRAVLTWHPADTSMVYASFSEGFRSGEPESYYSVDGLPGFPSVKPDKLYNYEAGTKSDLFDNRLSVDAAVYYMDWKDIQQQITVPFAPGGPGFVIAALINGQSARGTGVDFGLSARPLDGLELSGNISWNDLAFDTNVYSNGILLFARGDRPNFSPEETINGSAGYSVPLGGSGYVGKLSLSVNYTSSLSFHQIIAGAERAGVGDPVTIVNADFTVFAPQNWQVKLFVNNLANWNGRVTDYPNYNYNNPNAYSYVRQRPRTIGVQIDYKM